MADYSDGSYAMASASIPGIQNYSTINGGGVAYYPSIPNGPGYVPNSNSNSNNNHYHGLDIDTATIVSIASSCIILISGCIAVVCLIMYMKKTDMLYRSRTCAKCGAHVPGHEEPNPAVVMAAMMGTPISVHSEPAGPTSAAAMAAAQKASDRAEHVAAKIINYQLAAAKSQPNITSQEIDSIVIYRGLTGGKATGAINQQQQPNSLPPLGQFSNAGGEHQPTTTIVNSMSGVVADFFGSAFKNNEAKTSFIEDDEAAPYATFNLPGFESDSKISDTYETFAAKFSEPPYMLLKKGIECPPQYADSVVDQQKIRTIIDDDGSVVNVVTEKLAPLQVEPIYHSTALSQYHSIASCSSNQEELIRAYEYGKQQKQKLLKLQNEVIKQLSNNDNDANNDTVYRSLPSDHESPTDPGIREFTKSPPKPNEKRQGIVFHHQPSAADLLKHIMIEKHQQEEFNSAKTPHGDDEFKHELSSNETTNSFSSIKASSSNDSDDSTPSAGSELGNDEASSSSTATPSGQANETASAKNFGAISRDRSRNPSWATYTTMKSNSVLQPNKVQTNIERAFVTFPENNQPANPAAAAATTTTTTTTATMTNNNVIKEGLSSDEDVVDDDDDDDDDDDQVQVVQESKSIAAASSLYTATKKVKRKAPQPPTNNLQEVKQSETNDASYSFSLATAGEPNFPKSFFGNDNNNNSNKDQTCIYNNKQLIMSYSGVPPPVTTTATTLATTTANNQPNFMLMMSMDHQHQTSTGGGLETTTGDHRTYMMEPLFNTGGGGGSSNGTKKNLSSEIDC